MNAVKRCDETGAADAQMGIRAGIRFWSKVTIADSGCWLWKGYLREGYGRFRFQDRFVPAHRFSYETFHGAIPQGLVLDHLCRVRHCVNPRHLEVVTDRINILRGNGVAAFHARKTHCRNGHAFDEANTYFNKDGSRKCRKCSLTSRDGIRKAAYMREYAARRKAEGRPIGQHKKEVAHA